MEPWYKVATPRKEVREGRSFNPDEFAIALEQVVAGTAPEDYRDPAQFFARTCFTRALREHAGMVLRRLSGRDRRTPRRCSRSSPSSAAARPTRSPRCTTWPNGGAAAGVRRRRGLAARSRPQLSAEGEGCGLRGQRLGPAAGRETPWIDIARQLAGDKGVEALGPAAKDDAPGTEAIARVFQAAGAPVLLLFDEVLNFLNRHRGGWPSPFHAFIQNLTRRHDRHHARGGGDQPAPQPGRDDGVGSCSGRTRSRRWCGAWPRT